LIFILTDYEKPKKNGSTDIKLVFLQIILNFFIPDCNF